MYSTVTSCTKSEKSNGTILRKMPYSQTDRRANRAEFIEPSGITGGPKMRKSAYVIYSIHSFAGESDVTKTRNNVTQPPDPLVNNLDYMCCIMEKTFASLNFTSSFISNNV